MAKGAGRDHSAVLRKLLAVLVSEWGYDEVAHTLEQVGRDGSRTLSGENESAGPYTEGRSKKAYVKPSAMDIVSRLDVAEARKALLMELADQFESKRFLPGIGDVRNFLEMRGKTAAGLTQRAEAFRRILNALMHTPNERLEGMVRDMSHSGPSQLGPLSDAIKSTRAALRASAESREPGEKGSEDRPDNGEKSSSPPDASGGTPR